MVSGASDVRDGIRKPPFSPRSSPVHMNTINCRFLKNTPWSAFSKTGFVFGDRKRRICVDESQKRRKISGYVDVRVDGVKVTLFLSFKHKLWANLAITVVSPLPFRSVFYIIFVANYFYRVSFLLKSHSLLFIIVSL